MIMFIIIGIIILCAAFVYLKKDELTIELNKLFKKTNVAKKNKLIKNKIKSNFKNSEFYEFIFQPKIIATLIFSTIIVILGIIMLNVFKSGMSEIQIPTNITDTSQTKAITDMLGTMPLIVIVIMSIVLVTVLTKTLRRSW